MAEHILIIISYLLGLAVGFFIFQPGKQFEKGWNKAKAFFTDFEDGFREGVEHASKIFQDYSQGFGDGFEAGCYAAVEQESKGLINKDEQIYTNGVDYEKRKR